MNRPIHITVICVLLLTLALTSCAPAVPLAPAGQAEPATTAAVSPDTSGEARGPRGDNTLIVGMAQEPDRLCLAFRQISAATEVSEGPLMRLMTGWDSEGNWIPILIEELPTVENGLWKIHEDGSMEITWHFKKGLKWSELTLTAYALSIIIGIPIGVYSALRQYKWDDYIITSLAFAGLSMPVFWSGILMILLFSVQLHWLPPGGMSQTGLDAGLSEKIRYLVMPALALAFVDTAVWVRYTRSSMLEEIRQDYMRTARSKGLPESVVMVRHALRNALAPVVTLLGIRLPFLFSGAVVTETIFSWPGVGRLTYEAVINNDFSVAMIAILLFTLMVVLGSLLADICYGIVDPRVRYD